MERGLTELEGAVLGEIGRLGGCTPYALRREFQSSPTPAWSASAGAIYPLVSRLESRGYLRSREVGRGLRPGRFFTVTVSGRRALARWFGLTSDRTVVGVPPDPLRTRLGFLEMLSPADRDRFLRNATRGLKAEVAAILRQRRTDRQEVDFWAALAGEGVLAAQRARLAWMLDVRRALMRRGKRRSTTATSQRT